jgi:valyl-tRNA synthetase
LTAEGARVRIQVILDVQDGDLQINLIDMHEGGAEGAKVQAVLICPDAGKRELLRSFSSSLCAMTRAESIDIAESGAVPDDAGHALVRGVEVVVPLKELIDVEAELDKLARERSKIEQDLQRVSGKLGNENFLCNAPPDVVAKEQAKLAELESRLAKNEESRERLWKLR